MDEFLNNTPPQKNPCRSRNLRGFTIAEILLALIILGIVSVITISTVITNIEKKKIEIGLTRAYSILSTAIGESEYYNGPASGWNFAPTGTRGVRSDIFATTYLKPYLDVAYTCPRNNTYWPSAKCFAGPYNLWYSSSGIMVCRDCSYAGPRTDAHMFRLKNGMSVAVNSITESACTPHVKITVDIDGPDKGGSVMGRDVFTFSIGLNNYKTKNGKQIPDKQGFIPGIEYWNCAGTAWQYSDEKSWTPTGTNPDSDNIGAQGCGVSYGCNAAVRIVKNKYKIPKSYPLSKIPHKCINHSKNKSGNINYCP